MFGKKCFKASCCKISATSFFVAAYFFNFFCGRYLGEFYGCKIWREIQQKIL